MDDPPTIQNISPAYVIKVLIAESYGTFIIRTRTINDDILSSIQMNHQPTTEPYVVLSVRVDGTLYSSSIMNYRLIFEERNPARLLEQYYHSQRNQSEQFPVLTRELILPREHANWSMDPKEIHDINFDKSRFGGKTNSGVSEAIWQRPKRDAVKIFIKCFAKTSSYYENELKLLKQLCFFSITTFYGHYSDRRNHYLVFAYGGKSLESLCPIRVHRGESLIRQIVLIAFQISTSMIYLEKKNIVHRDLTARNVLIDDHGFIRIADFGHAIQKEEGKNNLSRSLTKNGEDRFQIRFLPPECMPKPLVQSQGKEPSHLVRSQLYASFSSKSDVWAFGILLVQLMLADPLKPYPHIANDLEIPQHIKINREMHPRPDGCNIDLYYILQQCWAYEPIDRISFTDIRSKMCMLLSILS